MNDNVPPKPQFPVQLLAFEMVGFLIAMYFFMGVSSPELITGMGLPILVQGNLAYFVGVISLAIGATPLIRWAIAQKTSK